MKPQGNHRQTQLTTRAWLVHPGQGAGWRPGSHQSPHMGWALITWRVHFGCPTHYSPARHVVGTRPAIQGMHGRPPSSPPATVSGERGRLLEELSREHGHCPGGPAVHEDSRLHFKDSTHQGPSHLPRTLGSREARQNPENTSPAPLQMCANSSPDSGVLWPVPVASSAP